MKMKPIFLIMTIILAASYCSNDLSKQKSADKRKESQIQTAYQRGMDYYLISDQKNYLKSMAVFSQLTKKKPKYAFGYAMISLNYSRLGQIQFLKQDLPKAKFYHKKALQYARYSLKLNKNLAKGYTALALYSRQIQNWPNIIKFANKAILFDKRDYEAYAILADGFNPFFSNSRTDIPKSIFFYKKSLAIAPYFIPACFNMSLLNFNRRKYSQAIRHLNRALKKNNRLHQLYFYLSISYRKLKKYPRALEMISKAINLAPRNSFYHYEKGRVFFKMKQLKKAIRIYKKAISLKSDAPQFYFHLGIVFYTNNKLKTAFHLFSKAIRLDDEYDLPYYGLGLILEKKQRYRLALKNYEKALDLTDSKILEIKVTKRINLLKKILAKKKTKSKE